MSDIKYVIERLGRDWNFGDVLRHKQRKSLISPFGEFKVLVPAGPNITQSFLSSTRKTLTIFVSGPRPLMACFSGAVARSREIVWCTDRSGKIQPPSVWIWKISSWIL